MGKKTLQKKYYAFVKQEKKQTKRKKNTSNYTMLSKAKTFIIMPKVEQAVMGGALTAVGRSNIQKKLKTLGKKMEKDYKNGEKKIQNNIMKNVLNLF